MSEEVVIEIDGPRAGINFSASHFLVHHNKCERVHGHNYAVSARIEGEPDENGILVDFTLLKRVLREICEDLDHHVLIPGAGSLEITISEGEAVVLHMDKKYVLPERDVVILDIGSVTAENLARLILGKLLFSIPKGNLTRASIGIEEAPGQSAWATAELGD